MWSFFWVLLIGGYWVIRLLNESGTKFAYQMRDAENNVKYEGLYAENDLDLRLKIKRLLISHPFYFSKDYCGEKVEEFEMIKDDLRDIFGDHIEYVSGCGWYIFDTVIANLLHSKSSMIPRGVDIEVPRYDTYYENAVWTKEVYDTNSYKENIGLRYAKKIEENIRKKYPDFTFTYNILNDSRTMDYISVHHELSFSSQQRSRRLWDDEPLSPDTAPTPTAPPPTYWKTK